jgi:hypothetical protein
MTYCIYSREKFMVPAGEFVISTSDTTLTVDRRRDTSRAAGAHEKANLAFLDSRPVSILVPNGAPVMGSLQVNVTTGVD